MAYKALYRTYRPTRFEDVVGQKHIIKILKNACMTNRISHAYVFSGLRGIGKTTIARIFSKAVNCELSKDGEPCNVCRNCLSIINDETTDVIELDAASNNGVDQMRDILEKVNFLPSSLKKKVYIIDEAHMLSTAAFNALLKTLEEPPAHVIFILATTEPYKLPSTILSRCQRLDFKQLSNHEIVEMLSKVIVKENIKITDEALIGIAEASEGGMRDALSILDQARVYESEQITLQDINNLTGRISQDYLVELIRSINEKNTQSALDCINNLIENGKECSRILTCLIQFCRDLLLYKNLKEDENIGYIYNKDKFDELSQEITEKKLFYYVDSFVNIQNKLRFTNSQKIYLEVGIIKLISNANSDIDCLSQIKCLEERLNLLDPSDNMDSVTNILSRLDAVENKVKKAINEMEKANIQGFKDNIITKINMLEDLTLANKNVPSKIEDKIQDLEEKIIELKTLTLVTGSDGNPQEVSNINISNENTDFAKKIDELYNQVEEIRNNNIFNSSNQLDDLSSKVENLSIQIEKIKTSSLPNIEEKENLLSNSDFNERLGVVEEYIDLLLNKVDELSRINNDNKTQETSNISEEINQLNENYFVLLNYIKKLQDQIQNSTYDIPMYNYDDELPTSIEEENPSNLKEEINQMVQSLINTLNDSIQNNYNKINEEISKVQENFSNIDESITLIKSDYVHLNENVGLLQNSFEEVDNKLKILSEETDVKISNIKNTLSDRINEVVQQIQTQIDKIENHETIDLSSLIETNKLSISDLKEYSIKLSAKVQEIQNKVTEINTKLDGGLTKRRSPFEYNRDEQSNEVKEEVKTELKEERVYDESTKQVKSNATTVVIRTKPEVVAEQSKSSTVYDIKIVERILNQAHSQACREEKVRLLSLWPRLEDKVGHLLAPTAKLLSEGILTANGEKELLIVFPQASMCNHLMEARGHANALQIIKLACGKDYDFIALPENTWQEKRSEYAGQFHIGIKYPRLTPINNPELKINVVNTDNLFNKKNTSMHQAQNLFGSDLVEREDDD